MKALILNFSAFDKKDKSASYYRFDMWDVESKSLYNIFTEQRFMSLPDGLIPSDAELRTTFPRTAEVDFRIRQFRTKDGKLAFAPAVDAIVSWKPVDLKKVF